MTTTAILTSIAGCLLPALVWGGVRHRLMCWYAFCAFVCQLGLWGVILGIGTRSAAFYLAYHISDLIHPAFQIALLIQLYARRVPDTVRWITTTINVGVAGAIVFESTRLLGFHAVLAFGQAGLALIVLSQVLVAGIRLEPLRGGLLLGLMASSSLTLFLDGVLVFEGVERWTALVQRFSLLPWGIWATTVIHDRRSLVRKAVAVVRRGVRMRLLAGLAAARNTTRHAARFPKQLALRFFAFWPPFTNQWNRKG